METEKGEWLPEDVVGSRRKGEKRKNTRSSSKSAKSRSTAAREREREKLQQEEETEVVENINANININNNLITNNNSNDSNDVDSNSYEFLIQERKRLQAQEKMEKIKTEFMELKEKVFSEKIKMVKQEHDAIVDGSHEKLQRRVKEMEERRRERVLAAQTWRDYQLQNINNQFDAEKRQAEDDFLAEKNQLRERMISLIGEKQRKVEEEKNTLNLIDGDPTRGTHFSSSSRALRHRRGNTTNKTAAVFGLLADLPSHSPLLPIPSTSTRKKLTPHINYSLRESEINEDLAMIFKPLATNPNFLKDHLKMVKGHKEEIYVENGVLHYKGIVFEKGQSVAVEREISPFSGVIVGINPTELQVKHHSGANKVRIPITHVKNGKVQVKLSPPPAT